jgi:hypothetical protein
MTKEEIKRHYQSIIARPISFKDGGYILGEVSKHAKSIINENRKELVSVFKEWLELDCEPYISQSIALVSLLKLEELKPELEHLREKIFDDSLKLPAKQVYISNIDRAIDELS